MIWAGLLAASQGYVTGLFVDIMAEVPYFDVSVDYLGFGTFSDRALQ